MQFSHLSIVETVITGVVNERPALGSGWEFPCCSRISNLALLLWWLRVFFPATFAQLQPSQNPTSRLLFPCLALVQSLLSFLNHWLPSNRPCSKHLQMCLLLPSCLDNPLTILEGLAQSTNFIYGTYLGGASELDGYGPPKELDLVLGYDIVLILEVAHANVLQI